MTRILTFLVALLPVAAFAQDTQTEKEAARDVLRKMAALEQSLDVPGLVARVTAPNADRDQIVARVKELMDKELLAMGDDIATHPEIEEKPASSVRTVRSRTRAIAAIWMSTSWVGRPVRRNSALIFPNSIAAEELNGQRR